MCKGQAMSPTLVLLGIGIEPLRKDWTFLRLPVDWQWGMWGALFCAGVFMIHAPLPMHQMYRPASRVDTCIQLYMRCGLSVDEESYVL